jgi:hypothetical protein
MKKRSITIFFNIFLILSAFSTLLSSPSYAGILERVVAVVDEEIVLSSELEESLLGATESGIEVTRDEVLNGLINRILLLKQAKKIKRKHIFTDQAIHDDNVFINEYINKRLKAFIRIPYHEVELFYDENRQYFGEDFYDVRDEIEAYLVELELNKRLQEHLETLKKQSYIRIQLDTSEEE